MRDKADLSDRNDQLEHIVLQLQGESDTIGNTVVEGGRVCLKLTWPHKGIEKYNQYISWKILLYFCQRGYTA